MRTGKKKHILRLSLTAVVFCLTCLNLFSYTWWNQIGLGYCGNCEKSSISSAIDNTPIETNVIEGAGYFLNGYSDMLKLSNRIELSDLKGLDYQELNILIDSALSNMEKAKEAYLCLIRKAESTPYNQTFIDRLIKYDYDGFASRRPVNLIIFNEVRVFLINGDINGLLKNVHSQVSLIVEKIKAIKDDISSNRLPEIVRVMELNELFSRNLMAGQYGAMIFGSINEIK